MLIKFIVLYNSLLYLTNMQIQAKNDHPIDNKFYSRNLYKFIVCRYLKIISTKGKLDRSL